MSNFILKTEASLGTTSISNIFLDSYMPKANGEYVKVYLYLIRALQSGSDNLSVAGLADVLDHTESDVKRALKYWEKQHLLKLECDQNNDLQGIYIQDIPSPDTVLEQADCTREEKQEKSQEKSLPARKSYNCDELTKFSNQIECRQLLFVCEQYLKKTLTSAEIETLFYFYDQLHFSTDLIEYLVEYCVCKGSRSIHYIETVALAWADANIKTVSQAKERTTTYTKNCFAIMKAFGINDRNPVEPELEYIKKWLQKYDFTIELVLEACRRTMERLHKPSFEYADQILKSWVQKKIHTIQDVKDLDEEHQKKNAVNKRPTAISPTRFTNFEQRDYNFEELEKQLIHNQ